ncbi:MAG: diguanylate cyclase [Sulfuriflexus sp.]|nr:diguanylate cyclase [Sulfuriflexus sp.]
MPTESDTNTENLPHLLVVDDSRLMRRAIGKILGKEYRITEAEDGKVAWELLQSSNDIQVVFSDLSMPNLDGFGLLELIRNSEDPSINELPVIIITGAEDDDAIKHKALNNGASDFISKPFESAELRTRAKTHIRLEETHKKLNQTESELEAQATVDKLTGLSNKKYFESHIVKDLSYAKRHRCELTLIFLEVDNFQTLFLKQGKTVADEVLKKVADIGRENIRNEDTLARIGLSKLAFILPAANRIGAKRLAQRISQQISDIEITPVTTSIGIAAIDINNDISVSDIINLAEEHLQQAHQQDSNSIIIDDNHTEEEIITSEPEKEPVEEKLAALKSLPDMNTATQMASSDEAERLQPYLAVLLKGILPLLKLCNSSLKLEIDEAITRIEKYLA